MADGQPVNNALRDSLYREARRLQQTAMSSKPIPMPQRTALRGQAAALFEQWLELEAARFNHSTSTYNDLTSDLNRRIQKLEQELQKFDRPIEVVEKATEVMAAVDRLLKIAVRHAAIQ